MPTMLCRSCGKIIPLSPVECPQCRTRQDRTEVPSRFGIGAGHVIGALLFGAVSGLTAGFYFGYSMNQPEPSKVVTVDPSPAPPAAPPGVRVVTPAPPAPRSGAVNYRIDFRLGSPELTSDGEAILSRVADTLRYYPLDDANVIGYAGEGEDDAPALAQARAFLVKALLCDRHGVPKERVRTRARTLQLPAHKAEVYIVPEGAASVGSAQ